MAKRRNWPVIQADVPEDVKTAYAETWQRLGFASEREFSRHLIRKAITENKSKRDE